MLSPRGLLLLTFWMLTPACNPASSATPSPTLTPAPKVTTMNLHMLNGDPLPAEALADHVVLFVNVASHCGYTPQYEGLEALYQQYKDRGLVVVGVPCNQFGEQEPGSPTEIASFCKLNYGVSFPLLEKQEVNGANRSPLYASLVGSPKGGGQDIRWNFEKFLVGRDGQVIARFPSKVAPLDAALTSAVEGAL